MVNSSSCQSLRPHTLGVCGLIHQQLKASYTSRSRPSHFSRHEPRELRCYFRQRPLVFREEEEGLGVRDIDEHTLIQPHQQPAPPVIQSVTPPPPSSPTPSGRVIGGSGMRLEGRTTRRCSLEGEVLPAECLTKWRTSGASSGSRSPSCLISVATHVSS